MGGAIMRVICTLLLVGLLAGCAQKPKPASQGYPVKIGMTQIEDVPHFVKGVGQLIPSVTAEIKAQVSGILTNVLFTDGQLVEEGALLMTIDSRIFEAQVQAATAQLEEDKAKLRYALDFAQTYGKLVGKEYVARLDYEQGVQNVDVYKATVEKDLANLKQAQVDLDYTQLRAPFKGYLGLRTFDPGNYVDANESQTLVTLNKVTPLAVKFFLSSDYLYEIREKQKESPLYLQAALPDDPAHPLEGTLWSIDNNVNPQTGMFAMEGNIPNLDERGWPGQFVRVYLRLGILRDAVLVPQEAVVVGESSHYVFVLDEETMTVTMRVIGKGYLHRDTVVALWGLKGNEKVITDGQLNLYTGAKVYVPEDQKQQ